MARRWVAIWTLVLALAGCKGDHDAPARPAPAPSSPADPLAAVPWNDAPLDWTRPVAHATRDLSGYAGSAACTACHEPIAKTYAQHSMARTGMRAIASLPPADAAAVAKMFASATPVVHERSGFRYRALRRGSTYILEEALLGADHEPIATWEEPITHVLSAGSYGLALYSRRGDRLIHLPIDYYAKAGRWDLDPMAFGGNPRTTIALDTYCISCHSDEPAQRYDDPLPGGIGCERCHGPSKRHVASQKAEDTINPARLPGRRQLDVCAQCHQSTFATLRPGRDHFDFHPGEPADAFRVNFLAEPAEPDRVKLLAHAERLVLSACWLKSQGKLTCTTCHDPHVSSLERTPDAWDAPCLGCHARTACTDTPEHRAAAKDRCTSCHMRAGTTSNVPLVAVTDHWIQRRPPPIAPGPGGPPQRLVAWSTATGEPVSDPGMAGITALAHADAGLTDEAVRLAALAAAKQPSAALYDLLANAYLARHRPRDAARAYRSALHLDPDDAGALLAYARISLDGGQRAEAEHALDRLIAIDPRDASALETRAILLFRTGDRAGATAVFQRAADTGRATGASYVGLAIAARDPAAALTLLELAWRAQPRDRWILDALARAADAAHDRTKAADVARRRAAIEKIGPSDRSAATAWLP